MTNGTFPSLLFTLFRKAEIRFEDTLSKILPPILEKHYLAIDANKLRDPLECITVQQLRQLLGGRISRQKIYRLNIPQVRLGNVILYRRADVDQFLQSNTIYKNQKSNVKP